MAMQTDVLLCAAPCMSVVRPSVALGTLQRALTEGGIKARSSYLNILFAKEIGLDLNERINDKIPIQLLVGEWLFSGCLGSHPSEEIVERYRLRLERFLGGKLAALQMLRDTVVPQFVSRAAESIIQARPAVVGFSLMFEQTAASLAIAKAVKTIDPAVPICFGGASCHGPMGPVLLSHYEQVDYVFTGEADEVFPTFVQRLLAGSAIDELPGVIHRNGASPPASPLMKLDRLPIPDYDDYFRDLTILPEVHRVRPSIPFESARGCWWGQKHHCTFCGLNGEGMVFRAKSSDRVLTELDALTQRYGVRRLSAVDNILAMPHITSVLGQLAAREPDNRPGKLFYEVKSNLNERQLELMARAGVTWIQPGIESLSDDILRIMRKGVSALLNVRLLRNCREIGIGVAWNLLCGFPGEAAESYRKMAAFTPMLEHLQPPNGCYPIRIDRFSPNFEMASELGFSKIEPAAAYAAIFDLPAEALHNLAYFFDGVGAGLADEESVAQLQSAVAAWQAGWRKSKIPPTLDGHSITPGMLVFDTRLTAVEPIHYLGPEETAVLTRLRDPVATRDIELTGAGEVLRQLIELKLVLEIDGAAISLVTESERAVNTLETYADLPLGYVVGNPGLSEVLANYLAEPATAAA